MTSLRVFQWRARSRSDPAAKWLALILLAVPALAAMPADSPAQTTVFALTYSAKYICGPDTTPPLPPLPATNVGVNATIVEVHNPHSQPVNITVKVIQDFPFSGVTSGPTTIVLPPNGAIEFDCEDFAPSLPGDPYAFFRKGFVEILTPRQLKVVAVYKQFVRSLIVGKSVAVAKKTLPGRFPPFFPSPRVVHSGTFLCGDTDIGNGIETHETTISINNLTLVPVNFEAVVSTQTAPPISIPMSVPPQGYVGIHCHDLIGGHREGSVSILYPGSQVLLECEEIINKRGATIGFVTAPTMSVVEVQPVAVRP